MIPSSVSFHSLFDAFLISSLLLIFNAWLISFFHRYSSKPCFHRQQGLAGTRRAGVFWPHESLATHSNRCRRARSAVEAGG